MTLSLTGYFARTKNLKQRFDRATQMFKTQSSEYETGPGKASAAGVHEPHSPAVQSLPGLNDVPSLSKTIMRSQDQVLQRVASPFPGNIQDQGLAIPGKG